MTNPHQNITQITSTVFSCGSLLIFIAHNVYKCLHNYENSIVGLFKSELKFYARREDERLKREAEAKEEKERQRKEKEAKENALKQACFRALQERLKREAEAEEERQRKAKEAKENAVKQERLKREKEAKEEEERKRKAIEAKENAVKQEKEAKKKALQSGSDFNIQKLLGSGHFGKVHLADKDGHSFAIKKVVNTERNTAEQEIKILKQVDHETIIKYYDHFMEENILCIVLEYADVGTMENAMKQGTQNHEEWSIWRVIGQLSGALAYLHARNPQILHHDLKPDNILGVTEWYKSENKDGTCWKLADFGVAKMLTQEAQEAYYGEDVPGVPTYMGPEVLCDFETYSAASDVWSLGCVIAFYMRKGKHIFNSNDDVLSYKSEMASNMIFDEESTNNYSSILIQLVCTMIQVYLQKWIFHTALANIRNCCC